jgi:ATP-dependent DNA helicase DinG
VTEAIERIFAPGGPIARTLPAFEPRAGQLQMAQVVERALLEGMHSIVEAGTGVGKSLGYLVPAIRSGKKVVLSTGTIALQEQLVTKDIPLVGRALGIPLRVTLLKGRSHYLCRQKFERLRSERLVASSASMQRIWAWGDRTATGDRAELPFLPPSMEWEQLDADADDCTGEFCEHFRDCYFFRKRDEARYADIVVVNHALFFLDLACGGGLLPAYDVAVLDEAHQCERWAIDALTSTVSRATIGRTMRKLHRTYQVPADFEQRVEDSMRGLESALAAVRGERYPLSANAGAWPPLEELRAVFYDLENWILAHYHDSLKKPVENEAEAQRRRDLAVRAISAHASAIERAGAAASETISWVERTETDGRYALNCAPYDVSDFLRGTLFAHTQSVVMTSATIAVDAGTEDSGPFGYFKRALGVQDALELVAPSPFDFQRQARLFVAPGAINPKDKNFSARAAPLVEECLDRTRGRAFVLFTSYERLRELYALLRERLPYPVKLQGELPRTPLLEWFRSTPNAVLFATGTFWEGIDVVGDALSCVIIDRLPFPTPSDPLVAARMRALEERGLDGFANYMIPAATVRLKQGFGRLIRSTTDKGVVALLDGRAASMRYGATILNALPPARRIYHLDELASFFDEVRDV